MNAEQALVDCIASGVGELHDVVDQLVGGLLASIGYSARATDGVLFEWESVEARRARGVGIVVMIDGQFVEPLRVAFELDAAGRALTSGLVDFGDSDSVDAPYGSRTHRRMCKRMLLDPEVEFPWVARFRRLPGGWQRVRP